MSASEHDQFTSTGQDADAIPTEREALLEQIEETREELGATVEALAHKADIKGQVHTKVEERKAQVQEKVEERKQHLHQVQAEATGKLRQTLQGPEVPAAIAAVGVLLLLIGRRRRRRRAAI